MINFSDRFDYSAQSGLKVSQKLEEILGNLGNHAWKTK